MNLSHSPGTRGTCLYFNLKFWASIVVLISGCATPSILVTREQNLGDTYFNSHDYGGAITHYENMLDASRKLGIYRNLSMESDVHRKIANCYEMTGLYTEALDHVHQAMDLDSSENNLLGKIEDMRHEGKIYIYQGSYLKGISSIERSLDQCGGMDQSLKDINRLTIADNYLVLAQLYGVMGKIEKALTYSNKCLSIFNQAGDKRGEMESYLAFAGIYSDLGDLSASQNFIEQSLKIAEAIGASSSRHYQLLAGLSTSAGRYEEALRYQDKALEDASRYRIIGQIIWANVGMGDIYRELGDMRNAERYYRISRKIRDTASVKTASLDASMNLRLGNLVDASRYYASEGSITGEGISLLRLSEILIKNGKPDSALICTLQAADIFNKSHNSQGVANVQILKGRLLIETGDYSKALFILDSARMATDFPETTWQAWFHLGRLYEKQRLDDKAIEAYRNSILVIEKIRGNLTINEFRSLYFDSKREVYDKLINILLRNNRIIEAFQISEQARARAFYDLLSNRKVNFRGSATGDLVTLEQDKRIEMQKLYKMLQKGTAGNIEVEGERTMDVRQTRSLLNEVQSEYEDIVRKIKLNNPAYAEVIDPQPVSLADIQSRIDGKTAALEYWISDDELIIWLITHSEIVSKKVRIGKAGLNKLVEDARNYIENESSDEMRSSLAELYKILVGPVEQALNAVSDLIIIPNQSLHFLPFQALINSKGEYLVQKVNLTFAPSASVFKLCNDRLIKSGNRFMGMALADISVGSNSGLPGTEEELKQIMQLFPDNITSFGLKCTEKFARENSGSCNFLHIATHGSYNYRQPLYSFLLFPPDADDDGRLNVFEVFEMNLDARLVTLSACETGLGNISQGDELTGLSRAFLFAGASSVIVSLWSVADYPTTLLMTNFYKYLRDHSMQESLTLAQRDVIKQFPQPSYWAPFILIGNGNISGY